MDQDSREQYQHFLLHSNVATDLFEFREEGGLRMVSLVDRLVDGLSSVYTFFEPDVAGTSYGTYNVLWQIERCQALGLPYLYLGYWIAESRKMAYKATFRPIEGLVGGVWQQGLGARSEIIVRSKIDNDRAQISPRTLLQRHGWFKAKGQCQCDSLT